ncbi:methyltransferase domain-containing protein [bacterium]|nr:methyltransferase domain-containing protein [bacterium]
MRPLTSIAHDEIAAVVSPGDIAVDATAGNGHDTLFLAQQVGPTGRVFACDRQPLALEQTAFRLRSAGCSNVTLIEQDHCHLAVWIPEEYHGRLAAVMFNLGYLPGAGKLIITQAATTVMALEQAARLLRKGGIITVVAYTGHPGGLQETAAVENWMDGLSATEFEWKRCAVDPERQHPPRLLVVRKRP